MQRIRRSVQPQRLGRRTFLRGALAGATVAVALPSLDIMLDDNGTAHADGTDLPKRFGVFYWGGGIVHATWVPSTTGADWELPDSLQPFAALRDHVTLVSGTQHNDSTPGHIPARGIALSSSHDMTINTTELTGTYRGQSHPEPSVDALVAEHWRGAAPRDLVAVGICRKGPYRSNSSWQRGGTAFNRHEPSPPALFDLLFGAGVPTTDTRLLEVTSALERSMLDAVLADATALSARLGRSDALRLEQHLEGLRALERRLAEIGTPSSCVMPDRPIASDFDDGGIHEEKEAKAQLMSQLLAYALACDLTRVFSYEWSATQSEAIYWEVGVDQEHHQLNHDDAFGDRMRSITRFIMQNLAYLAEQLRAMPEGAGNVLDRTLILATSEHATAGNHNYVDHPFLLIGKAGGSIRAGQHWRHPDPGGNRDAPRVLLTAVRAVGVPADQLGQASSDAPRVARDSIGELEA